MMSLRFQVLRSLICLVLLLVLLIPQVESNQKKTSQTEKKVFPKLTTTDVLQQFQTTLNDVSSTKQFSNEVLVYVTPWNSHGYDVAKLVPQKFDWVSPVWHQIVPGKGKKSFEILGNHDVDSNWIEEVRKNGNGYPQIVPRFHAENWQQSDFYKLIEVQAHRDFLADLLVSTCKQNGYDGLILEMYGLQHLTQFFSTLHKKLKVNELKLILVIPPWKQNNPGFSGQDFQTLSPFVDRFSLMTYDYSNSQSPGPNSPISWVKKCIEKLSPSKKPEELKKILVGLNFYGYDYRVSGGGSAVVSHQFKQLLETHHPNLLWSDKNMEPYLYYHENNNKHIVYFPSSNSIQSRLELASELGVGISIWEIGQGMDAWYELL